MQNKISVVTVVGPTASGKTALAVEIAKRFSGEVISADSMQIYHGMDIATAKPTKAEMQEIPHHLIGFLNSGEEFSVADYCKLAHEKIKEVNSRGKLPILAGGTGLYVDSVLKNIKFSDYGSSEEINSQLRKDLKADGVEALFNRLSEVDPISAERLKKEMNPRRIIRALEVFIQSGQTVTSVNENSEGEPIYNALRIGIGFRNRENLYSRINSRVDKMVAAGLLDEAKNVIGERLSKTSSMAIGYKELMPYFDGEDTLESCLERLKMQTRRYAKRQLTWFKRDEEICWFMAEDFKSFGDLSEAVCETLSDKL